MRWLFLGKKSEFTEKEDGVRSLKNQFVTIEPLNMVTCVKIVNTPGIQELLFCHLVACHSFIVIRFASMERIVHEIIEKDAVTAMPKVGKIIFVATIPLAQMELEGEIGAIALHITCAVGRLDRHDLPHPVEVAIDRHLVTTA